MTDGRSERKTLLIWFWAVAGLGAIVTSLFLLYVSQFSSGLSPDHLAWGSFGDYLGGTTTPLISFVALLALLHTIKLQSTELRRSTEQLRDSAQALQAQNTHWQKQLFENTFFHLIASYRDVVLSTEVHNERGRRAFTALASIFENDLERATQRMPYEGDEPVNFRFYVIAAALESLNSVYEDQLAPYTRTVLSVLGHIHRAPTGEREKEYYASVLRSQLSPSELYLLFYIVIGSPRYGSYREQVVGYQLFNDLDPGRLPCDEDIRILGEMVRREQT